MAIKRRYTIDFSKLVGQILPSALRINTDLIYSLLMPLQFIHNLFIELVAVTNYYNVHSGQVIYLEKVLNDKYVSSYDPIDHDNTRQIEICDGEKLPTNYLYREIENNPTFLNPVIYLFSTEEYNSFNYDFVVTVPGSLSFDKGEMKFLIEKHKIAGRTYKIQIL